MRTRRFDAVLIDFAGTLFFPATLVDMLTRAGATAGEPMSEARIEELTVGLQQASEDPEVQRLDEYREGSSEAHRRAVLFRYLRAGMSARLAEAFYDELCAVHTWEPFKDTRPFLEAVRERDLPVVVVSNTGWDLHRHFEAHGMADLVADIVHSCHVGSGKPGEPIYAAALASAGVEPSRTIMVGDDPVADTGIVELGGVALVLPYNNDGGERGLDMVLPLLDGAPSPAGSTL